MRQLVIAVAVLLSTAISFGAGTSVPASKSSAVKSKASFYGGYRLTASGERFNANSYTAAHKTLPFGSMVRVENVANGKSVDVRINNRGPFIKGRDLDLTAKAFQEIAPLKQGVVKVNYSVISLGEGRKARKDKIHTLVKK